MAAVKRNSGFTLLEMMVVIAIIGLVAGVASFSVSGGERRLDAEGQRLRDTLQLAADQSVTQGDDMALYVTKESYGFLRYDMLARSWQPYDAGVFKLYALPDKIQLSLEVERAAITLSDRDKPRPMLLFLSSGERAPFQLTLTDPANGKSLTMASNGAAPVTLIGKAP